ncbi:hypothetical protein NP233_g6911 [Leucocoprinus birnbaumii]|uniref:S-adenosylmethionine-dependent methyltransferase n=1 Tax=Leucocoprinus birnbaumii TaxID=56174 RepID=A0AAD5VQ61_9AGAR|nr:hypothetical protein NP233_g6911 [Leucocoprinus birnbaumii]
MVGADLGATSPSSRLPPIKKIPTESLESLKTSVHYLRFIYNPEVRGSRRQKKTPHSIRPQTVDSIKDLTSLQAASLDHLRLDTFERAYAIRWLTALIAALHDHHDEETTQGEADQILRSAAALLAVCAGTSAAGTVVRDFTFYLSQNEVHKPADPIPISVTITDLPLNNDDFGSVGAQTWGGACVLSEMLVEDPRMFGLSTNQLNNQDMSAFRVLELGAGTGLVSLTVAKLLDRIGLGISRRFEIVATDYYPSVLTNLQSNAQANISTDTGSPVSVLTHPLDWSGFGAKDTKQPPFDQPFDLVLGADIVYEPKHAAWIRSCLTYLLRRPSATSSPGCNTTNPCFHLVLPLRATFTFESSTIESAFIAEEDIMSSDCLGVLAKDTLSCDTETGEEVEYAYYRIGWVK